MVMIRILLVEILASIYMLRAYTLKIDDNRSFVIEARLKMRRPLKDYYPERSDKALKIIRAISNLDLKN